MQQAIEDIGRNARKAKDTSNEHQQTVTEMQFVKSETVAVKKNLQGVAEKNCWMGQKLASFEETFTNLKRNVTFANVTKKTFCHGAAEHKTSTSKNS